MAAKKQKEHIVHRYPYSIVTDNTDYLQIDVVEYKPIGRNNQGTLENASARNLVAGAGSRRVNDGTKLIETVLLPIPSNISDTNAAKYGESELNTMAAAAVGAIKDVMESGGTRDFNKIGDAIGKGYKSVTGAIGGLEGTAGFVTRKLASAAAGIVGANVSPEQILARGTGEILNPNLELLFGGPTLRSFRFSFKMTPRNEPEAEQIKNLIRCFKMNMAPKVKGTSIPGTMMKTPNVFELRYRSGNHEHLFLNRFKQCFLENISVNYTADGTYATYSNGTPVSMTLDLSFKELEPIYDIDYDNVGGVGY
jgi:hypothetical protein